MNVTFPHSPDAEAALLGYLITAGDDLPIILEELSPEPFYLEANRLVFAALMKLYAEGRKIELVSLMDQLSRSGALAEISSDHISGLTSAAPLTPDEALQVVNDRALQRELVQAGLTVQRLGQPDATASTAEALDRATETLFALTNSRSQDKTAVDTPIGLKNTWTLINEMKAAQDGIVGLATGLSEVDKQHQGFQKGRLYLLAGRPGMGKTQFALEIAGRIAVDKAKNIGYYSLEMPHEELYLRVLCRRARIDHQKIPGNHLHARESERLVAESKKLEVANFYIDDGGSLTISQLRTKARRQQTRRPHDLLIVDYIQLMDAEASKHGGENRVQDIAKISRGLKQLARELNCPVIALSQLSRAVETRPNKRPMLSDLRDSGSLEQDADAVIFLYRDEYYDPHTSEPGVAELIYAKQRNGPIGTVKLAYGASYGMFETLAQNY